MDKQDKNTSSHNLDERNNALDHQATLVGNEKTTLLFGDISSGLSEILIRQKCNVTKMEMSGDKIPIESETKFDVIVLGDFLQCIKNPVIFLKKLNDLLNPNGYLVCSITNIAHAYNRIKLLNGEFAYTPNGLINENFIKFYTLDTILSLLDDANYSITKLYRKKEDLDLVNQKDIKYFTIPDELIESIKNDPESLVSQYVFSAIPKSTNKLDLSIEDRNEFSRSMVTERLRDLFRYHKEDKPSLLHKYYEKKLQEKDSQIKDLEKKVSKKTS